MYNFIYGCFSDKGKGRENQDVYLIEINRNILTFAVADGMGGYEFGRETAKITIDAIKKEIGVCENNSIDYLYYLLQSKYIQINDYVYNFGIEKSIKMGTTLSMINIINDRYLLSNVGDTRIYNIRNSAIKTISKLQNVASQEYEMGKITLEEYKKHKQKNVLTQCIGIDKVIKPYFVHDYIEKGDIFILCSDGVYNFLTEEYLKDKLTNHSIGCNKDIECICKEIIEYAMKNGSDDNLTIMCIKVK